MNLLCGGSQTAKVESSMVTDKFAKPETVILKTLAKGTAVNGRQYVTDVVAAGLSQLSGLGATDETSKDKLVDPACKVRRSERDTLNEGRMEPTTMLTRRQP